MKKKVNVQLLQFSLCTIFKKLNIIIMIIITIITIIIIIQFFIFFFQTPLGLILKNENVNEDMVEILKQFQSYLPQTGDQGVDGQVFSGDQLTVERAVNVIASVANGFTPKDRLEGINMQLGDWHAAVKLLSVSKTLFTHQYSWYMRKVI